MRNRGRKRKKIKQEWKSWRKKACKDQRIEERKSPKTEGKSWRKEKKRKDQNKIK